MSLSPSPPALSTAISLVAAALLLGLSLTACGPGVTLRPGENVPSGWIPFPNDDGNKPDEVRSSAPCDERPGISAVYLSGTVGDPGSVEILDKPASGGGGRTIPCTPGPCATATGDDGVTQPDPGACHYAVIHGEEVGIRYNGFFGYGDTVQVVIEDPEVDGSVLPDDIWWRFTIQDQPPRDPVAVALVLDRSGSMGSPTSTDPGAPAKIEVLKDVSEVFYDFLQGYPMMGDRTGAVFFSNTAEGAVGPDYLVDATDARAVDEVADAIANVTDGGSTSIGAGLNRAQEGGLDAFGSSRKYILLLTDGRQNTNPRIDEDALPGSLQIDGRPFPSGTQVWVVSIGAESAARTEFNNQVTEAGGGGESAFSIQELVDADDENEFIQSFLTVAADAVIGDKTEQIATRTGTMRANRTQTERIQLSKEEILLSLVVSWTNPQAGSVDVRLAAPDGTEIPLSRFASRGDRHLVAHVPLPVRRPRGTPVEGEWSVRLTSEGVDTDYSFIAYADNASIVTTYGTGPKSVGTGSAIPLRVSLQEAGAPIRDAEVMARVRAPGASIGTVLARADVDPQQGEKDALTPSERKLQALVEQDPDAYRTTLPTGVAEIQLEDPDGDGVYTASFPDTETHGTYKIDFEIKGSTSRNGTFTRARTYPIYVRSRPDPASTSVEVRRVASGTYDVVVTPMDAVGNLLGPGFDQNIQMRLQGGDPEPSSVQDNLDGSFTQRFAGVKDLGAVNLEVRVLNEVVAEGRASDFFLE